MGNNNFLITYFINQQELFSRKVDLSALPNVPWQVRQRQLWIIIWYEPNYRYTGFRFPDNYFRSLDGIFNGTLSYRNDSLIRHHFYSENWRYVESSNVQVENAEWENYKKVAVTKKKYVLCFILTNIEFVVL